MTKSTLLIFFAVILCGLSLTAQQADAVFKVSKPNSSIRILPPFDTLVIGKTYDLLIPDMKLSDTKEIRASFGTLTFSQSKNGKDIELKVTVGTNYTGKGSITILSNITKKTSSKKYCIVARGNTSEPYMPSVGGGSGQPGNSVRLLINNDTISNSGKVSLKQLKGAITLSLSDQDIPAGFYIRKNLMCQIKLMHDTSAITLYSAQDRLSDKVKLGLSKAKAGDKVLIDNLENLWIDSKRDDHLKPYSFSYLFTIIE